MADAAAGRGSPSDQRPAGQTAAAIGGVGVRAGKPARHKDYGKAVTGLPKTQGKNMGNKQNLRYGRFFLKPGRNKEGIWEIYTYNKQKRQTEKCASTDTPDLEEAILAIKKFSFDHDTLKTVKDLPVLEALNIYYLKYANKLAGHQNVLQTMKDFEEVFADVVTGEVNVMVSEMELANQTKYIDAMRSRMKPGKDDDGNAIMVRAICDATITRRMGCAWAAFQYCKDYKVIASFPSRIRSKRWNPDIQNRDRLLTFQEIGYLFNQMADKEHQWRSLILFLATGGRSSAIADMTDKQYQAESKVLDLNPPGRRQTHKHRPVIPVADCVASQIQGWGKGYFIQYRGKRVAENHVTFFRRMIQRIDPTIIPYHLRHFVSTWLVTRISPFEKDMFMGHAAPKEGSKTGAGYNQYDPSKTHRGAARAIQELFEALAPFVTKRSLLPPKAGDLGKISLKVNGGFGGVVTQIPPSAWQVRVKSPEFSVENSELNLA